MNNCLSKYERVLEIGIIEGIFRVRRGEDDESDNQDKEEDEDKGEYEKN